MARRRCQPKLVSFPILGTATGASAGRVTAYFSKVISMKRNGRQLGFVLVILFASSPVLLAQSRLPDVLRRGGRPSLEDPRRPAAPRSRTEELRNQADLAYQQGNYEEVVELTTQVIAAEPEQPFAWYQRASARIELGKLGGDHELIREGISDAREALRLGGKTYVFLYVPYLYGLTALSEIESRPQHADLAIQVVSPVLERTDIAPNERGPLFYQRGLAHMAKGDFESAAADFSVAIQLSRTLLAAYFGLAEAYTASGDLTRARSTYNRAVEMFPDNPLAFNNRGTFLQQQGEFGAAIEDFSRAIELNPNFTTALTNRGFARGNQQDYRGAEYDYVASLKLDTQQPLVYRLLGTNRLSYGAIQAALEAYSSALQLDPEYPEGYADRAFARYFAGDTDGAIDDLNKALELDSGLTMLVPWKALVLRAADKADESKAAVQELGQSGEQVDWPTQLARYLAGSINDEQLLKSAMIPEQVCDAHYFIAQRADFEGKEADAKKHYEECVKTGAFRIASYRGAQYALGLFTKAAAK